MRDAEAWQSPIESGPAPATAIRFRLSKPQIFEEMGLRRDEIGVHIEALRNHLAQTNLDGVLGPGLPAGGDTLRVTSHDRVDQLPYGLGWK